MLYAVLGTMLLAAVLAIVVPLYRQQQRLSGYAAVGAVVVLAISVSVYSRIGSPDAKSPPPGELPSVEDMVGSLAERLQRDPNDLAGWKLLGRSYAQMRDFDAAVAAFERANEMENGQNGQTLADLGEVILMGDRQTLSGRAGELFDNALAVSPNNQKALFYSGMAALERGDRELAAARWETLLATSPPQNIQEILREQIAELRGAPPPLPIVTGSEVVTVRVALGESAMKAVQADSTVFIIARDPAQPSPPIAAVRRRAAELPIYVPIGDSDAMTPGRLPSAFAQLEIVARVSTSGEPMARPGDWFGQQIVSTAESNEVSVIIDKQIP